MDFIRNNIINILIFVLLVGGGGGAYYYFFAGDSGELLTSETEPGGEVAGELLTLLSEVPALTVNEQIFTEGTFRALKDFSVAVPDEVVGRPNPFAPLSAPRTTGRPTINVNNAGRTGATQGAVSGKSPSSPVVNTSGFDSQGLDESRE